MPQPENVGFQVGYESPSQFSREYARCFGQSPTHDMKQRSQQAGAPRG